MEAVASGHSINTVNNSHYFSGPLPEVYRSICNYFWMICIYLNQCTKQQIDRNLSWSFTVRQSDNNLLIKVQWQSTRNTGGLQQNKVKSLFDAFCDLVSSMDS